MFSRSATMMITALLMYPQIAETIYSPAQTCSAGRVKRIYLRQRDGVNGQ